MSPNKDKSWHADGSLASDGIQVFPLAPKPRCVLWQTAVIGPEHVAAGRLYRVVDEEITKVTQVRERVVSR
jgi:hypothetical protein